MRSRQLSYFNLPLAPNTRTHAKLTLAPPPHTHTHTNSECFHSGNHIQGVFHWIPVSCQYWDDAYLRTLVKAHNHYQGTNIVCIDSAAPWAERFRKVHVMWERKECSPPDWQNRNMP